eukprot:g2014.t1
MCALFEKGTACTSMTYVWSEDLRPSEWTLACNVQEICSGETVIASQNNAYKKSNEGSNDTTASLNDAVWYYVKDRTREQIGPMGANDLRQAFREGSIDGMTLVWSMRTQEKDWIALSKVTELKNILRGSTNGDKYDEGEERPSSGSAATTASTTSKTKHYSKRKRKKNLWIYVSGFDCDVDISLLAKLFKKYGMIDEDVVTSEPKIRLYRNDDGTLKGDASVCYVKDASVELAISLADGLEYKSGFVLSVSRAEFDDKKKTKRREQEENARVSGVGGGDGSSISSSSGGGGGGSSNCSSRPSNGDGCGNVREEKKRKRRDGGRGGEWGLTSITKQEYDRRLAAKRKKQAANLGWASISVTQKIVVLKNVFTRKEVMSDPNFVKDLKVEMREGASEFGNVSHVTVAEHNPEGVVLIHFTSRDAVEPCVGRMDGRYFGKRKLAASVWDGYTNHVVGESEESRIQREKAFENWLGKGDEEVGA